MKEFAKWFKALNKDVTEARFKLGGTTLTDEELRHWVVYWRSLQPVIPTTTYISTSGLRDSVTITPQDVESGEWGPETQQAAAAIGDRYLCRECKEHRLVW